MIEDVPDFSDMNVTVMGLGTFGGGIGVTRYLCEQGADVLVTDLKEASDLRESMDQLDDVDVEYVLGEHRERDFRDCDMVVVNPAVPMDSSYLQLAREEGVPLESELNLFVKLCPSPIIGITGTAGKSTTTALVGAIFQQTDRETWVGGNIGNSLLNDVNNIQNEDMVVLEISSFQLLHLRQISWSPDTALITNITPNHLDRHGTFEAYRKAKFCIVQNQMKDDVAILNAGDSNLENWPSRISSDVWWFSGEGEVDRGTWIKQQSVYFQSEKTRPVEVISTDDVPLAGSFNMENTAAAVSVAMIHSVDVSNIRRGIMNFEPLPHHLTPVTEKNGIRYIDDSVSTSPDSVARALEAVSGNVVVILGGYDKDLSFQDVAGDIVEKTSGAVLIGQIANHIEECLREESSSYRTKQAKDMAGAVRKAEDLLKSGSGTVLLCPGTASYDMYNNYRERGEKFQEAIWNHLEHGNDGQN